MAWIRSRRRNGRTFYLVRDRQGRERSCGSGPKGAKLARRLVGQLEKAEWEERVGLPVSARLAASWTLEALRDRDVAGLAQGHSRRRRWTVLLEGLGSATPLDRITPDAIRAYADARLAKAKPQTVNNDLSVLCSALRFAAERSRESGFQADPCREVRRLRPAPRRLALAQRPEAVAALIARAWAKAREAPAHLEDAWRDNAAMIELAYETFSRISQIHGLERAWVGPEFLRFPPQKGGNARHFRIVGRLKELLELIPERGPYFFPGRGGEGHRDNFRRFWSKIAPAGMTPHALRHSAVTNALYAGASIPEVAARCGHKTPQMVARTYAHIFPAALEPMSGPPGKPQRKRRASGHPGATHGRTGGHPGTGRKARKPSGIRISGDPERPN
ncbi:MAG TPA: tyrosine-type recombinase/integrase [Thermoanaerobaculia bacterium]|nr:tyrosine-type recombinase/integrase [Thermoanaerobaculia bacterium]